MLEIIEYGNGEYNYPCLLVLGCFDSIHVGHRELLKKAKLQAKINGLDLGVMTFVNGKGDKQVYTFEERKELLEKFNVKFVYAIDFNAEFKKITALEFLEKAESQLNVKAYMSGKDFRFGAGAKGKSATLKKYAEDDENGVWYMPVKEVVLGEEKVSTTAVKEMLANGDIEGANTLLGENFFVVGKVVSGAGRGATMGFPTINVSYDENKFEIKHGVYKVSCAFDNQTYVGIANFGARPTFEEDSCVLEVYLDGFEGDLYDKQIKVEFEKYIRDIVKFDSEQALVDQIRNDLNSIKD